ncbi:MAG: YicC/YloC family endoribonuclease [Planctomycetaceae bacterium]
MALSMTGCGVGNAADSDGGCRVEIRGVNGRQLKVSIRGRDTLAAFESRIEAMVRRRV